MLALSIPLLNSLPDAPVTLYIDFDGAAAHVWNGRDVHGPGGENDPVPAFSIDANTQEFTDAEVVAMSQIWQYVAEKYSPFQINVSTHPAPFLQDGVSASIVVGGKNSDWYFKPDVGGVAKVESFTNELSNHGFVFSAGYINYKSDEFWHKVGGAVAHEAGHIFGLYHQVDVDGNDVITKEYSDGNSIEAPIMGNANSQFEKRGTWRYGPVGSQGSYIGLQDDLGTLTRPGNAIQYRQDDYGPFFGAGWLNFDTSNGTAWAQGVIERNADQDAFTFYADSPFLNFDVTNAEYGGMLAPTLELVPLSGGGAPAVTVTTTNTSARLVATNLVPGAQYVLRVKPQGDMYGNLGQYYVEGYFDTFASLESDGELIVYGYIGMTDDIIVGRDGMTDRIVVENVIAGQVARQSFPASAVRSIRVALGDGNDSIRLRSSIGAIPVKVDGGDDTNTLVLEGSNGADTQWLIDDSHAQNGATPIEFQNIQKIMMATLEGADTVNIWALPWYISLEIYGGKGRDNFNLAPDNPTGVAVIRGPVGISGQEGSDVLSIGSGMVDALATDLVFDGGGSDTYSGDQMIFNDQRTAYQLKYDVTPSFVERTGLWKHKFHYVDVEDLTINAGTSEDEVNVQDGVLAVVRAFGNDGNDKFTRGNGNLFLPLAAVFNGGNGLDSLKFDDHLNAGAVKWSISPHRVDYGGLLRQDTTGTESISILAGPGANEFTIAGVLTQALDIDAGGGDDSVTLNDVTNYRDFAAQDGPPGFHSALVIDGGGGFNTLTVDDSTAYARSYAIWPDRMLIDEGAPLGLDFDYDSFQSVTVQASLNQEQQFTPEFHVFGTSSDIPSNRQMTILGSALADLFVIHPHDGQGNRTINGNLGVMGGGGSDTLVVDDAGSSLPINYRFHNQFGPGTTNIGGLGSANFGAGSDVERIEVHAGGGDDAFKVDSVLGSSRLSLLGGGGADVLDYSSWTTGVAVDLATGVARGLHTVSGVENAIGGSGNDLLIGDAAANRLDGRGGRDLVSGGAGADSLTGGDGEDIMLAGGTTYSATGNSNNFIMAEWMRTDLPFAERVNHLLNGGGLNGATLLNRQSYATDPGGNTLIGADSLDLFFGSLARDARDYQRSLGEVFIDVDGIEQGSIRVDATALGDASAYVDYGPFDATKPYYIPLQPGSHNVKAIGGDVAYFTVTEDGLIDYDQSMNGIFSGRGTTALVINGVPIQVDAATLGTTDVILDYARKDPSAPINGRMMPGVHHLQILGGTIAYFTVKNDGTVDYDPALDGVMSGRGTSVLRVNGASIQVDATALETPDVVLDYARKDPSAPINERMMPGVHHLQIFGGTIAYFTVTSEGTVDYDPALEGALTGRGTNTLHVIGRSVTVDATMSGGSWVNLDYTTEGTTGIFARAMMPGKHFIYGSTGVVYYFTMNNAGMIEYDPNLEGVFTGWGTNVLRFDPQAIPHPRPADVNHDGAVNGDDLVEWNSGFGVAASGDADGDNDTDGGDFLAWQRSLGSSSASSGSETAAAALVIASDAAAVEASRDFHDPGLSEAPAPTLASGGMAPREQATLSGRMSAFETAFGKELELLTAEPVARDRSIRAEVRHDPTNQAADQSQSARRPMARSAFAAEDDRLWPVLSVREEALDNVDQAFAEFGPSILTSI